jgi:hypothetical protein
MVEVVPGERTSEDVTALADGRSDCAPSCPGMWPTGCRLEHLGPPTQRWWRDLRDVTLTRELIATLVAGVDDELGGLPTADLVALRDAVLTALLVATSRTDLP